MNINFADATPHRLNFACPTCSAPLSMNVPWSANATLNTEKMEFDSPCPSCGAAIVLPGGKYQSQDGTLVRTGDYESSV